jgi:hypothetical protein
MTTVGNLPQRLAQRIGSVPSWVWLMICGIVMTAVFYFGFTVPYPFATYADKANYTIARLGNFSADSAFLFIGCFVVLFGFYLIGLRIGLRPVTRLHWLLVVIFAVIFNAVLLPMYPVDAADVYDYIIRGRMTTIYGLNPMIDTPAKVKDDPFYKFAAWRNVPSAYGAGWEVIAAAGTRIAGDDQTANVMIFKLIDLAGNLLTMLFIALTLRLVAPKRALLGVYLFAWNPLVPYMTTGSIHQDTVMAAWMVIAVYCMARRWYTASTLAALVGALIKFIPVMMIPFIALIALRQLKDTNARIRYVVSTAVLGGVLFLATYGPFWRGLDTLGIDRRTAMYTGSVATVARQQLGYIFDGRTGEASQTPNTNNILKWVVLGAMALFGLSQLERVLTKPLNEIEADPVYVARITATVLLFYLTVACIWFQSWYVLWLLPLVALLDDTPLRRVIILFSYLVTWQSFLYNYVTLRIGTGQPFAPIPYRDLIIVAVVQLPIWGYVIYYWLSTRWRQAHRTELNVTVGQKLAAARQVVQLTPTFLADLLNLRTDDVVTYERGEKSIPINTAALLSDAVNLDLSQLIEPVEKTTSDSLST